MSDTLANKIAAGEVVQRPASVAKELIENAVDAGAGSIELIVKDAGSTLVQVVDDGCGMSRGDARRCFDRHATSKIRSIDDLDRIRTLGFRGEALASIASIAHVDLKTRRVEDEMGTEVRVEGGEIAHIRPCAAPGGTSVAVRNLFYNVPARRNFLKTPATELKHLTDTFRFLALANPGVAFRMTHKGRPLYDLAAADTSNGSLRATERRIADLLELKDRSALLDVQDDTEDLSVEGFVFDPRVRRKKRKSDQFLYVNGRYVQDRYLSHAVRAAYGDLLPDKTFPFFALFLSMDPRRVDVNVHPTKAEVKFEDESGMYGFLKSAVRQSLAGAHQTPQFKASGRGATASSNASGGNSGTEKRGASSSATELGQASPQAKDDQAGADASITFRSTPSSFQPRQKRGSKDSASAHSPSGNTPSTDAPGNSRRRGGSGGGPGNRPTRRSSAGKPTRRSHESSNRKSSNRESGRESSGRRSSAAAGALTHELYRRSEEGGSKDLSIGPVWSLHGRYLLTPTRHGLLVIDQRAAHVRVLYEEALEQLRHGGGESQQLLFPKVVDLEPAEEALIEEWLPELEAVGFDVERMSGRSVSVRGVPTHIRDEDESTILQDVLETLRGGTSLASDQRFEHLARALARKSAVPRGAELSQRERRMLIRRLMDCEMPYADPTGTPTTLDLSLEEIDKRFRDATA